MNRQRVELADLPTMNRGIRERSCAYNRERNRRGRNAAVPTVPNPLQVLGSLAWWVRSDNVLTATGVSQMTDLSGNGRHFTQATGSLQPALVTNALNGRSAVRADGVDDRLTATWARVGTNTQPVYLWFVAKQISWTLNNCLFGDFNAGGILYRQSGVTPQIGIYNGLGDSNQNSAGTIGSYFRHEVQLTNSVADYVQVGATNVSGTNAGPNPGGGTAQIFATGGDANFYNGDILEGFAFLGTPTVPQRNLLNAYCASLYGAGLT